MTTTLDRTTVAATISSEFRHKLREQIRGEHDMSVMEADNITTDTLSFLSVCAQKQNNHFRPSKQVDIGWHQFILNTIEYREFCERVAGRFLDHTPDEFTAPRADRSATQDVLAPTVAAIQAAGLPFHPELWLMGTGKCSQCHSGCTNCGQADDPHCN